MRVAVTGATGHLGSFVVRNLLARGASVAAVARPESDFRRIEDVLPQLTVVRDLQLRAFAPDVVMHLAWSGITREARDSADQIHVNVPYALAVFRASCEAGARCWIGLGSQAEYGPRAEVLREDLATRPQSAYGVAKAAVAELTEKLSRIAGMRFVWMRLLATYGPADDERHLIPMLIHTFRSGVTPSLSTGDQYVDYLYVEDAAEALCAAAYDGAVDGTFNLASGEPVRVREIAELVRDLVAPGAELGLGRLEGVPVSDLRADVSRFRAAARWSPRTNLRDGIARTARWYQTHGATS